MTTLFTVLELLRHALTSRASSALAVIGAIAALVLACSIGAGIVITSLKGRSKAEIHINLGRSRRVPP